MYLTLDVRYGVTSFDPSNGYPVLSTTSTLVSDDQVAPIEAIAAAQVPQVQILVSALPITSPLDGIPASEFITEAALVSALANTVQVVPQSFDTDSEAQARENIGLGAGDIVGKLSGTPGYLYSVGSDGSTPTLVAPPSIGTASVTLNPGYLLNGYAQCPSASGLNIAGAIDVRWFGTLGSLTGSGFQALVTRQGVISSTTFTSWMMRETAAGKLQFAVSADGTSAGGGFNTATCTVSTPAASGYCVTYDPSNGHTNFYKLDPTGSITFADGSKWTQLGTQVTATVTGSVIYTGSAIPLTVGAVGNGTSLISTGTTMTKVEVRSGIDGTVVANPNFTNHQNPDTSFADTHSNTWTVGGSASIVYVSGSISSGGSTLTPASQADLAKFAAGWGTAKVNPITGCYHPYNFGPVGVDPSTWTVAQQGAAVRAARDAAVAAIVLSTGQGQSLYLGRSWTIDADPSITDPVSGLAYCGLKSYDYLTIKGAGMATTLKLADGANCHVIGHPGRLQADGSQDQIFNFTIDSITIDANKATQDGTHKHDAVHIPQHPGYQLTNVRILNPDGRGIYTTALGEFSSVPPRSATTTSGSTVWTTNTAPSSIVLTSVANFPITGTTVDVFDGGGNLRSVKYTGITGSTLTGVTLLGGVAVAGTVAAGSPVYVDAGVHSVRPTFLTNVRVEGAAQWGYFLSATNRDTSYSGCWASSNGTAQARIAGNTVAANIASPGGNLVFQVDNNSNTTVTLSTGDTPATVVGKINTSLGAAGVAALTPTGTLMITSATVGGVSKVYIQGTSDKAVLTKLGFTLTPKNGDNNYRVGANEYGGFYLDHSECTTNGLFADQNLGDGFYIHNVNACHYGTLHATRNNGVGIYVDALNHSTGSAWVAMMNCVDLGAASYRTLTDSAECYFDNGVEGYGVTKDSTIIGFNGPGDKSTIGNSADNRHANYAIIISHGVAANGSFDIAYPKYGDGGLIGNLLDNR